MIIRKSASTQETLFLYKRLDQQTILCGVPKVPHLFKYNTHGAMDQGKQ